MGRPLSKLIHAGLVLATVAAGGFKATAQTSSHKKSTNSASHPGTPNQPTSSAAKPGAKSATAKPSARPGKGKKSSRSKKIKGQAAPTPERISEIQDALAKRGMFSGDPTGKWDDSTVDAMKKFQTTNHLNPTGKLDAPTLQKLGFGSVTAGLGAPTPPPNGTANRLLSRNSPKDPEPSDEN
jgi:Putative peptidoglycan binding domain